MKIVSRKIYKNAKFWQNQPLPNYVARRAANKIGSFFRRYKSVKYRSNARRVAAVNFRRKMLTARKSFFEHAANLKKYRR